MDNATKAQIGRRLRQKRESAGYTREKLGELSALSPRFIANIELGDSTFSLDSLMTICRILCCSSDYLLFGGDAPAGDVNEWYMTILQLRQLDPKYQHAVSLVIQGLLELVRQAEQPLPDMQTG